MSQLKIYNTLARDKQTFIPIEAGKAIYRSKCYICHHSGGARGPNLFASKLRDDAILQNH